MWNFIKQNLKDISTKHRNSKGELSPPISVEEWEEERSIFDDDVTEDDILNQNCEGIKRKFLVSEIRYDYSYANELILHDSLIRNRNGVFKGTHGISEGIDDFLRREKDYAAVKNFKLYLTTADGWNYLLSTANAFSLVRVFDSSPDYVDGYFTTYEHVKINAVSYIMYHYTEAFGVLRPTINLRLFAESF